MAHITCAISGITFRTDHLPISIPAREGYFHPVFALPYKKLLGLYSKHTAGELTATDSYLLFCAFLHSTGQITWNHPASCNPTAQSTIHLIENNISQLIRVIELTNTITIPSFRQPSFVVAIDNSKLLQVPNWIKAWKGNIQAFREGYKREILDRRLELVEKKLTYLIVSDRDTAEYVHILADWADKAAEFPISKSEEWKKIIRSCYNSERMFSIPLTEIRELKQYCEDNIEPGSVHSFTLHKTLREGIRRHTDFLGMSPEALGYTIVSADTSLNDTELATIAAKAPTQEPKKEDYPSSIEFLKAKLRYRIAIKSNTATAIVSNPETNPLEKL